MEKKASASSWPWAPGVPLAMRMKESYKEYALPGFAFGSVIKPVGDLVVMSKPGFPPDAAMPKHFLERTPLLRKGVEAAFRGRGMTAAFRRGTLAAFRTPLFVCMEQSLAARRGQSDFLSFAGGLLGSYFPCRIFPALLIGLESFPRNLRAGLLFFVFPIPVTPNTVCTRGAGGSLYWLFTWWLIQGHKERFMSPQDLRSLYQDYHGFYPGFLRDFSD